MGSKLNGGKEDGPGCDEAASAAAGTSGDSGGGAPSLSPSTSPSPSPSTSPSRSPSPSPSPSSSPSPPPPQHPRLTPSSSSPSSSPPQSPRTASSSSSAYEESEEQDFDEFLDYLTVNSTNSQEDEREEEQVIDGLQEYLGTTHLDITHSQEWAEEQEIVQLPKFLNIIHLSSTCPEQRKIQDDDTRGVSNNESKLGDKEPVLNLDNYNDDIIAGQIMLLSKKYGFFRRIPGDGSCFYRAFIFSYLENFVERKDEAKRKAEAARLRQRVEKYMLACYSYNEYLLPAFYGFESVVNLIEQGLASGELYHMEKNEHVTSQILPLLRTLTEIEMCSREHFYHGFLEGGYESVFELCLNEVRPNNGEASQIQIAALGNALGIPILLENLDRNTPGRLNPTHFYPSQEFEAEALEQEQSVDSDDSTTPMAQAEHDGSRNLSPAERRRLVTLLYRPGHYDIIYPK